MERRRAACRRQAAVGGKVWTRAVGSPECGRQLLYVSEALRHRDERGLRFGVVDGRELPQPRRVDPYRHRDVRQQRVVVAFDVQSAVVERRMRRRDLKLSFDAVMMMVVEGRTQKIKRNHQHEQPPGEPPRAAHAVRGAARTRCEVLGAGHGYAGKQR